MFDRLVGRSVLSIPHRIVREDEDGREFHDCGEAYCRSGIVAENEERCAKWTQLRQRHPVYYRRHTVLADAEVHHSCHLASRPENSWPPEYVNKVLFEGPRSAAPPTNQGTLCARTLSVFA